jgi:hypothetical protein
VGSLSLGTGTEYASGNSNYATHNSSGRTSWTVTWTPALTDVDDVRIYAAGGSAKSKPVYATSHVMARALPVEMSDLNVVADGSTAFLKWQTYSESNNYGFEIQEAALDQLNPDVGNWNVAGFVAGAGTTSESREYAYQLVGLAAGTHVVRIKQMDLDGSHHYSPVVEVQIEGTHELILAQNYPNPFDSSTEIVFSVPEDGRAIVKVFDLLGREVAVPFDAVAKAGVSNALTFRGDNLPSGLYAYRLSFEGKSISKTLSLSR